MLHRAITLSLFTLLSCSPSDREPLPEKALLPTAEKTAIDESEWAAGLLEERSEKDAEFASSSTSPMAGSQYLKSSPGEPVHLTYDEKGFGLATSPSEASILEVALDQGNWSWKQSSADSVTCRVGDEELPSGSVLEGSALFEFDRYLLSFYSTEDRVTFIVFDPERAEMVSFEHLLYYPPDHRFAVDARLEVFGKPDELILLTSRNLEKTFYRYATIHFVIEGEPQTLSAFKYDLEGEDSKILFIPFRDKTSAKETYGAGRFLEIEEPEEEHFVLDFNRTFNPLCNYSPAYNCAIPPKENHLAVAIRAGELTYPHRIDLAGRTETSLPVELNRGHGSN